MRGRFQYEAQLLVFIAVVDKKDGPKTRRKNKFYLQVRSFFHYLSIFFYISLNFLIIKKLQFLDKCKESNVRFRNEGGIMAYGL